MTLLILVGNGRDKGKGYKYFLACAFTFPLPVVEKGEEPEPPDSKVHASLNEDGDDGASEPVLAPDLPSMEELFTPNEGQSVEATLKVVTRRVRSKRPESRPEPSSERDMPKESPPLPPPAEPPAAPYSNFMFGSSLAE